jgi:hypothetical protein
MAGTTTGGTAAKPKRFRSVFFSIGRGSSGTTFTSMRRFSNSLLASRAVTGNLKPPSGPSPQAGVYAPCHAGSRTGGSLIPSARRICVRPGWRPTAPPIRACVVSPRSSDSRAASRTSDVWPAREIDQGALHRGDRNVIPQTPLAGAQILMVEPYAWAASGEGTGNSEVDGGRHRRGEPIHSQRAVVADSAGIPRPQRHGDHVTMRVARIAGHTVHAMHHALQPAGTHVVGQLTVAQARPRRLTSREVPAMPDGQIIEGPGWQATSPARAVRIQPGHVRAAVTRRDHAAAGADGRRSATTCGVRSATMRARCSTARNAVTA